ncbi:MAG: pantothenate synthetase [Bacteroidota bacterium]|jgi:pantoate--beta-alanine ligase|nr:pantothenate synthetase [Bacteroidota bacterium]
MISLHQVQELQNQLNIARKANKTIGFVPTMGALHPGHLELVKKSKSENDITVCSIFVNPTQFNDLNDLKKYPRTLESDSKLLETVGCDIIFAPEVAEIYTEAELELKRQNIEDKAWTEGKEINFGKLDKVMEGAHRPGHFNGVAQVVSKLFRIVQPDKAYFGQKDFQQLAIIRSMTKQLDLPVEIIACPIVREADGLAMSSRNARLTEKERSVAPLISQTLFKVKEMQSKFSVTELKHLAEKQIATEPLMQLEYFEIADAESLQGINAHKEAKSAVACIAVKLGSIRLIDNIVLY